MVASFLVSLTLIPVLCSLLLNPKHGHEHKDGFLTRGMKWLLENTLLRFGLSQPLVMLGIVLMIVIAAFSLYPKMNKDFLPKFQEETALVAATAAPGTSLEEMNKISDVIEQQILSVPEVRKVGRRLGRAERGDHVVPVSTAEFDVDFREPETEDGHEGKGRNRKEILADITAKLKTVPGVFAVVSGPLADRIGHMMSGVSAPVAIKVFGPDLDKLRQIGIEIQTIAKTIPGFEDCKLDQPHPSRSSASRRPRPCQGLWHRPRQAQRTALRSDRRQRSRRTARRPASRESRHPPARRVARFAGQNRRAAHRSR
jgi:Cu/Ag efflux pump CusA